MHRKINTSLLTLCLTLTMLTSAGGQTPHAAIVSPVAAATTTPPAPAATSALAALPASDLIVFIDTQRLLTEALPSILATNPALLAELNTKLDEVGQQAGIDPRSFDGFALGARFAGLPLAGGDNFKFIAIAYGRFDATALTDAVLAASRKSNKPITRREEQYQGRTISVLTQPAATRIKPTPAPSRRRQRARKAQLGPVAPSGAAKNRVPQTMALTVLDTNMIAVGDLESVRATIDAGLRGGPGANEELIALATRNPSAVLGFSGNVPPSLAQSLGLGADPISKNFTGIRQIYGSTSVTPADIETLIGLRAETDDQARAISQVLTLLKPSGDQSVALPGTGVVMGLPPFLKNLSITAQGAEVQIKLLVAQSDLAPFIREMKSLTGGRPPSRDR